MRFPIVRLQVSTAPLVQADGNYDPSVIESVPRIEAGPDGVLGIGRRGEQVADVQQVDPLAAAAGRGLTIMGTGDYLILRERFGGHLTEGMAGETVLVEAPDGLADLPLPDSLVVHTRTPRGGIDPLFLRGTGVQPGPGSDADLSIQVVDLRGVEPSLEFARFCVGMPASDDELRAAVAFLGHGRCGYRGQVRVVGTINLGDVVEIRTTAPR